MYIEFLATPRSFLLTPFSQPIPHGTIREH
jgi:hypothetical protein